MWDLLSSAFLFDCWFPGSSASHRSWEPKGVRWFLLHWGFFCFDFLFVFFPPKNTDRKEKEIVCVDLCYVSSWFPEIWVKITWPSITSFPYETQGTILMSPQLRQSANGISCPASHQHHPLPSKTATFQTHWTRPAGKQQFLPEGIAFQFLRQTKQRQNKPSFSPQSFSPGFIPGGGHCSRLARADRSAMCHPRASSAASRFVPPLWVDVFGPSSAPLHQPQVSAGHSSCEALLWALLAKSFCALR